MSFGLRAALDKAAPLGLPVSVQIDLLHRCDLRCVHCYLPHHRAPGLTLERLHRLFDDLATAGVLQLVLSGGDPFLRPDALDVLRRARELRFCVRVLTHAGRIDDPTADALAELGVAEVGVSVYSLDAKDHEAVTMVPGSLSRTLAGIRRLRERGVAVEVKCIVTRANQGSWQTVPPWAEALGCILTGGPRIEGRGPGDSDHVEANNADWDSRVAWYRAALERSQPGAGAWPGDAEKALDEPPCTAGRTRCHVDPGGLVRPCPSLKLVAGDLAEHSFAEIWTSSPVFRRLRSLTRRAFLDCQVCPFLADCSLCPGIQKDERGDLLGRSALVCTDTHARFAAAHELGLYAESVRPPADGVRIGACGGCTGAISACDTTCP